MNVPFRIPLSAGFLFLLCGVLASAQALDETPKPPLVRGFQIPAQVSAPGFGTDLSVAYFSEVHKWGANVVRLQIKPLYFAASRKKELWEAWPELLDLVEAAVKNAAEAHVKVVPVLMQMPLPGVTPASSELWSAPDLEKNGCRFWADLSRRLLPYRDTVWGYDLFNEPVEREKPQTEGWEPAAWRPLALKMIEAIRAVDDATWIVYEVGPWDNPKGYKDLKPLSDAHVIYSLHFYEPHLFTHQGVRTTVGTPLAKALEEINIAYPGVIHGQVWDKARLEAELQPVDAFQKQYHVPIYVGEFSVVRWAPDGSGARWLRDVIDLFEARQWSWTYHAFRGEWTGWMLENDDQYWMPGQPVPPPDPAETDRAKVIRDALRRNGGEGGAS